MKKYVLLICFLTLLKTPHIWGQVENVLRESYQNSILQVIPSSPQSQIFENYLNHKITEYNGLPDINIPLYEVEIKGVKVPITLSYHAGGIKYLQFDGDVGAGWSINASGYRISRTIYGKADDHYPMYRESDYKTNMNSPTNLNDQNSYIASILLGYNNSQSIGIVNGRKWYDGEYDQYTYMTPTTNGKFIIKDRYTDTDKGVAFTTGLNRDIISILNKPYNTFTIKDDAGINYTFGKSADGSKYYSESSIMENSLNSAVPTAWPLTKIVNPFNQSIIFNYGKYQVKSTRNIESTYSIKALSKYVVKGPGPDNEDILSMLPATYLGSNESGNNTAEYNNLVYLDNITTDKEIITFERGGIDNNGDYSYLLKSIIIKRRSDNKVLKKILFNYQVSPENANTKNYYDKWHRLLHSIVVTNASETDSEKIYNFKYYSPPTDINKTYKDQWGFYKAYAPSDNISWNIHKQFLDDNILVGGGGGTYRTVAVKNAGLGVYFNTKWADRSSNTDAKYFALMTITFPTGGYTTYEYESHKFKTNPAIAGNQSRSYIGGGLRVSSIFSSTASNYMKTVFKYGNKDGDESGYGISGDFGSRYLQSLFANETFHYNSYYLLNLGSWSDIRHEHTIGHMVRNYSTSPMNMDAEMYFKVSYPVVTTYQITQLGSLYNGKTISRYNIPHEYTVHDFHGQSQEDSSQEMGYGKVFTSNYYLWAGPQLSSREYYQQANTMAIRKETYKYKNINGASFKGTKGRQKVFLSDRDRFRDGSYMDYFRAYGIGGGSYLFEWFDYYYHTGTSLLQEKIIEDYTNGQNPVVTTETYTYDDKHRLLNTSQTNSSSGVLYKEYIYPISGALASQNIIASPVKTRTKHNNQWIGTIEQYYPATAIQPSETRTSTGDGTTYRTEVSYQYYANGNIKQITGLDGIITTYLWSYGGHYPVAEIKSATYIQVRDAMGGDAAVNTLSNKLTLTDTEWNTLKGLQAKLSGAFVSVFRYDYPNGLIESVDPSGIISRYRYDVFGRLQEIRDHNNSLISSYAYEYSGPYPAMALSFTAAASYQITKLPSSFSAVVSGGSGQYQYTWEWLTPSNKRYYSSTASIAPPATKELGINVVKCTVKDMQTLKTTTYSRSFKIVPNPIEFGEHNINKSVPNYYVLNTSINSYAAVNVTFRMQVRMLNSSPTKVQFKIGDTSAYTYTFTSESQQEVTIPLKTGHNNVSIHIDKNSAGTINSVALLSIESVGTNNYGITVGTKKGVDLYP